MVGGRLRPSSAATEDGDTPQARGAYIFKAAGCQGCHTDEKNKGELLAGGRALKTPFGVFYSPNITPDPTYGIGKWSDEAFETRVAPGRFADGSNYYPALPYTSYTKMSDQDVSDLKAYILHAAAGRPSQQAARSALSLQSAVRASSVEILNFTPGAASRGDRRATRNGSADVTLSRPSGIAPSATPNGISSVAWSRTMDGGFARGRRRATPPRTSRRIRKPASANGASRISLIC